MSPKKRDEDDDDRISANPDDQVAGGGLLDDVDVTVKEVDCVTEWDYEGHIKEGQEPEPAMRLLLVTDDGHEEWQGCSAGKKKNIVATDDGSSFKRAPGSAATGVPSSSNTGLFMRSLGDAGYPFTHDAGLPEDYDPRSYRQLLEGLKFHMLRVPQPKRDRLATPEKAAKKFPDLYISCTKIISFPWSKETKSKSAAPAKGKAAKNNEDTGDEAADAAAEVVVELLGTKAWRKGIDTSGDEFYKAFFDAVKGRKDRKALLAAIQEESFLERSEFEMDGDTLTLA